ncbi:hypothetical protein [Amycolatopsis sulphurea]|uniref:hypothetical protein n=1 Tax=Amycolatopsis sulphurea TaxID=76022 RepID=UPI00114593F2|nr:hypothetical protein [Amycolatopsis sulphurea]
MGGVKIRFQKWEVFYFPAGQLIQLEEPIVNFVEAEDRLLVAHPRLRRFVIRVVPKAPLACFYLHWSDGSDLAVADERIVSGAAGDSDFAGAVVGEAVGSSHPACGAPFRVVDLNPDLQLFSDTRARWGAHAYQETCPSCGKKIYASILEFI